MADPRTLSSVCVFCGSAAGNLTLFSAAAEALADCLVQARIRLVYGGGSIGLMGIVANRVLAGGGYVIGVIPHALDTLEAGHRGLSERHVVDTMHERKALMVDRADAFVALPGGYGTMDELFEALSWAQLGIHDKPVGLLNVGGFFDDLLRFVDGQVRAGFLRSNFRELLLADTDPQRLLERLTSFDAPETMRWVTRGQR